MPIQLIPFLSLLPVILLLTIWGAGVFTPSLFIATVSLSGGLAAAVALRRTPSIAIPASTIIMFAAIIFILITIIPLPGKLDAVTGANRYEQNNRVREALSSLSQLEAQQPPSPSFSLSRNRAGTIRILMLAICVLCAASLTALMPPDSRRLYLRFLVALISTVALAGFLHQWIWPGGKTLWWLFQVPHGHPVGSFVNRTHFAGFIAMLAPACLVFSASALTRKRFAPAAGFLLLFLLISAVAATSLSRGAVIALASGTLATLLLILLRTGWRTPAILTACLTVACLFGIASLPLLPSTRIHAATVERLSTLRAPLATGSATDRLGVWRDSLSIISDYPLAGTGGNAFRSVFPKYRTSTDRESFKFAENEYIQLAVDFGLIGVLIAIALAAALTREIRSDTSPDPELRAAVTGAIIVAAVHNLVDFPLHLPLYSIVLASLVGLLIPGTQNARLTLNRHALSSALFIISGTLCACWLAFGSSALDRDSPDRIATAGREELRTMLVWSPTSWQTWFQTGQTADPPGTGDQQAFVRLAGQCIETAALYDPNNYRLWEAIGNARTAAGDEKGAAEAFQRMKQLRPWKQVPEKEKGPSY